MFKFLVQYTHSPSSLASEQLPTDIFKLIRGPQGRQVSITMLRKYAPARQACKNS